MKNSPEPSKWYATNVQNCTVRNAANEKTQHTSQDVAHLLGSALERLLTRKGVQPSDIFTQDNIDLIARYTAAIFDSLGTNETTVSNFEQVIESVLITNNAHDIANELVFTRQRVLDFMSPTITTRIIRRNGQVAPWITAKIEHAVRKAFLSQRMDTAPARTIAKAVEELVANRGIAFISIEDVQNHVQAELMRQGHFKVAESYILYRAKRTEERKIAAANNTTVEELTKPKALFGNITVVDGDKSFVWDGEDLRQTIKFASMDLNLLLNEHEIETELRRSLYDGISLKDRNKTIILNAKSLLDKDAAFSKFAGRMLLVEIYGEVLGWKISDGIMAIKDLHRKHFHAYIEHAIRIERLSPRMRNFNIAKLAEALDPMADLDFDYLGIQTLYDRYLLVDKSTRPHRRMETPQFFWMRVAMGVSLNEGASKEDSAIRLFRVYASRRGCSSTPTLFNSGTRHSQLSSCYLSSIEDSIESIMQRGIYDQALLSKWAGGLGIAWSAIRGTGAFIKGTNGESQGIIPFLKMVNDMLIAVNQGGKRRGAGCCYVETWHNDIRDFVELRRNVGDDRRRTHDMNTANWIPDLFMKRMEERKHWTLFRSNEVPDLTELYGEAFNRKYEFYESLAQEGKIYGERIEAIELWKTMLTMLFETGHPWITFKDPCNLRSPQDHVGVVHSSNLCTEITLNTSAEEIAVCNLASVVISQHLTATGDIDHNKLRDTVFALVRALDNVIDLNYYPVEAARRSNMRHRPIGLGMMGLQDALYMKNISFASQEAVEFNDEITEAIAFYAYLASSELAKEKGTYDTYEGSKWQRGILPQDTIAILEKERGVSTDTNMCSKMDWDVVRQHISQYGMRNSNVMAIAPTATISNIVGASPCIEPTYKNLYVKSNLSGEFIELNAYLTEDLKKLNLWNEDTVAQLKYYDGELENIASIPQHIRDKYKTAFDIHYDWYISAAQRRGKWIDQAQSLNLFLATPDLKTLSHMYRAAWKKGLKTTYYLRTLGASSVEKATVDTKKEIRGVMADAGKQYTEEQKAACSLEARRRGEECEACQ